MKIGTKSLLYGAHQFILHPFFVALLVFSSALRAAQDHDFSGYWRDANPPGAYCALAVAGDGNISPELDVCRATFAWFLEPVESAWTVELGVDWYMSSAAEECFILYEVDETEDYIGAVPSMAVWGDLGTGPVLSAETCVGQADVGSSVFVPLFGAAWEEIEAGGWFGVGIELTTIDGTANGTGEFVRFGFARLHDDQLLFADGFESGDVSSWTR